jgi:hypothetical protein
MTTEAPRDDTRTTSLWLSLASGPLLWAAYHALAYAIASLACQKGFWLAPQAGPISTLTLVLLALSVVFLLLMAWGGLRAHANWNQLRRHPRAEMEQDAEANTAGGPLEVGEPAGTREGFMAFSGLALNILFGAAIIVSFLSTLFFGPCS